MKICPVGAESLHADRRTDMTMLNSRFSQFCERALKTETVENYTAMGYAARVLGAAGWPGVLAVLNKA
jgi:hypothetical protein